MGNDSDIESVEEVFPPIPVKQEIQGDKERLVDGENDEMRSPVLALHTVLPDMEEIEKNGGNLEDLISKESKSALRDSSLKAVRVKNGYKSYQKGCPVLQDFNMNVPSGAIYSLLGSSGCGKTTLLSCVVGLKNLDKGEIRVFGHAPGTKESGIPGRRVGYMPQELALYNELTIGEALNFYGRIYGMDGKEVEASAEFLLDFLNLPKPTRQVGSLSGGQKRRVSIAIALLHRPQLLILDEPTVGVDPLLRQSIWEHLVQLAAAGDTTIIITTHYVEEARQSNVVGIMRNGRLLAEESPDSLLTRYRVNLLEDIVLSLCRLDRDDRRKAMKEEGNGGTLLASLLPPFLRKVSIAVSDEEVETERKAAITSIEEPEETYHNFSSNLEQIDLTTADIGKEDKEKSSSETCLVPSREGSLKDPSGPAGRLSALLLKNFTILMRNLRFLFFLFLLPTLQIIFVCLTVGPDPSGLNLGVVNQESCRWSGTNWKNISETCPLQAPTKSKAFEGSLSCFFLALLPDDTFILKNEETQGNALEGITSGSNYGYIEFPKNFTENFLCRFGNSLACRNNSGTLIDNTWDNSNIIVELDMSNKQVGQLMKKVLMETYAHVADRLKVNCMTGSDGNASTPLTPGQPLLFRKPVYGTDDTTFVEFIAPNSLLALLFFFPFCFTGISYISEKRSGTLDRALVAGVGTSEFLGGFLVFQVVILAGQAGLAFVIVTQVYQIEILGSVWLAMLLSVMVGVEGTAAGFLTAMFCTEEIHAVLLAMGTFFPNMLLSGMVWPLEGMAKGLQYFAYCLPCTLACDSMRSIVGRGWGMSDQAVWLGFLVTVIWTVGSWALAAVMHRFRSKV